MNRVFTLALTLLAMLFVACEPRFVFPGDDDMGGGSEQPTPTPDPQPDPKPEPEPEPEPVQVTATLTYSECSGILEKS